MKNFRYICLMFLFCYQINVMAQRDSNNKSIKIPAIITEEKKDTINLDIKLDSKVKVGEKQALENKMSDVQRIDYDINLNKPKKPFSMIDHAALRNSGELFEENWNTQTKNKSFKSKFKNYQLIDRYGFYNRPIDLLVKQLELIQGNFSPISFTTCSN